MYLCSNSCDWVVIVGQHHDRHLVLSAEHLITQSTVCRDMKNFAILQYTRSLSPGNIEHNRRQHFDHARLNANSHAHAKKIRTYS